MYSLSYSLLDCLIVNRWSGPFNSLRLVMKRLTNFVVNDEKEVIDLGGGEPFEPGECDLVSVLENTLKRTASMQSYKAMAC